MNALNFLKLILILTISTGLNLFLIADEKDSSNKKITTKDIINMPANTWISVPNTKMNAVTYTIKEASAKKIKGSGGPQAIMSAWSGGTYDSKRDRLIIWGGGHNDYYGNDLYAFSLKELTWKRIKDAGTPRANAYKVPGPYNADGSPASRHTYNTLTYIAHADRFFGHGGSMASGLGSSGFKTTFTLDFEKNKWHDMKSKGTLAPGSVSSFCAYDPKSKKVFYNDGNYSNHRVWGLYSYDFDTNIWQKLNKDHAGSQTCVIDSKRNLLIGVGAGSVSCWDIGKKNYKKIKWKTTGGEYLIKQKNPGLSYIPSIDKIISWHGGSVFSLDIDKKIWTEHKAPGAPTPAKWGTFGRWQYVPFLNAFVVVNKISENVYFYKHTAGAPTDNSNDLLTAKEEVTEKKIALADLPSKPGSHIEKIKKLGDNEWLVLGKPTADPKWGVARGRAWGARAFAYAPDLQGAFFCGSGVHAYVKPNGHYMDDFWFYDVNKNSWICLYPGANTKTLKLKLNKNGFEVNDKNEIVPVSYLSHANSNMIYNSHLKKLVIIFLNCPWWPGPLPQRRTWLDQNISIVKIQTKTNKGGNPGSIIKDTKHPLYWDVMTGKWERQFVTGKGPGGSSHVIGITQYVPSLKKVLFIQGKQVWEFDSKANKWTSVSIWADRPKGGWNDNGCFDSKREKIYFTHSNRKDFMSYDVKNKSWSNIKAENQPKSLGISNEASLYYDSANSVLLWHGIKAGGYGNMRAFDPDKNKWSPLKNTFPKEIRTKHLAMMGFYDSKLNVHFFYLAGDSSNKRAVMLAYRYKRSQSKLKK